MNESLKRLFGARSAGHAPGSPDLTIALLMPDGSVLEMPPGTRIVLRGDVKIETADDYAVLSRAACEHGRDGCSHDPTLADHGQTAWWSGSHDRVKWIVGSGVTMAEYVYSLSVALTAHRTSGDPQVYGGRAFPDLAIEPPQASRPLAGLNVSRHPGSPSNLTAEFVASHFQPTTKPDIVSPLELDINGEIEALRKEDAESGLEAPTFFPRE